jgi:hypothetical protein
MNVIIDAMQPSPASPASSASSASRALWWFALSTVVIGGLIMRCLTIDRTTPGLGAFVYFAMLLVLFVGIACPVGAGVACLAHWFANYWRKAIAPHRLRWLAIAVAALITIALYRAGHRMPEWHVWVSGALFTALLSQRVFETTQRLLSSDARNEDAR